MTRPSRAAVLGLAAARRIALAAQGFADPAPATPTMRTLTRCVARTGVLQIDSVNVLQRAHFLPLYSRMGPYDVELLRRAAETPPRRLVEYWAHVAAFMPVELWPVMRFRMERYREQGHEWLGAPESRELVASLLAELADRGPSTSRDLDDGLPRRRDHWGWNWSRTKQALEYLFVGGQIAVAGRNSAFERVFDLPERVLPSAVLQAPALSAADAHVELVRRAARSHGVATVDDLRDYYRLAAAEVRPAVDALVQAGELIQVTVEGWAQPAYVHVAARRPRRVDARALLSPFDPLVWRRRRAEDLFGFRYRIEIYTPAERRTHGYYVLPFLLGERLVARVDLKARRDAGTLLVRSAWQEAEAPAGTARHLAEELARLACWLGLDAVRVEPRGDLAGALDRSLRGV